MKHTFDDIRSRISEPPSWFDSNGTPRYGEFTPGASPKIYADEVALVEIACQCCNEKFLVEIYHAMYYRDMGVEARIRNGSLHCGDPPAHDCTGDTMNCLDLRVVQYWHHKGGKVIDVWERVAELEIALPDASEALLLHTATIQERTAAE
jgi:hypothetical protein